MLLPTHILVTLLLGVIVFANPSPPTGYSCHIVKHYSLAEVTTYTPSNPGGPYDKRPVYLPVKWSLPEKPLPVPLVIYPVSHPNITEGIALLNVTLKNGRLLQGSSRSATAAKVVAAIDSQDLLMPYFGGPMAPVGMPWYFNVKTGCGYPTDILFSDVGDFCVRKGTRLRNTMELFIKTGDQTTYATGDDCESVILGVQSIPNPTAPSKPKGTGH